jgi:hypothetical protein
MKSSPVLPVKMYSFIILSHVGIFFTLLINSRLLKWSEENDILTAVQFRFRPGLGTTDAILALHSLISNTSRKGKCKNFCQSPVSKWPPQYRTNSTLSDFNDISYVGRLWCPELIPDIKKFLHVAIFKKATLKKQDMILI